MYFFGQTTQVFYWLSRYVVEVDHMPGSVEQGEEECSASYYLVKLDTGVQWYVLLDAKFLLNKNKLIILKILCFKGTINIKQKMKKYMNVM